MAVMNAPGKAEHSQAEPQTAAVANDSLTAEPQHNSCPRLPRRCGLSRRQSGFRGCRARSSGTEPSRPQRQAPRIAPYRRSHTRRRGPTRDSTKRLRTRSRLRRRATPQPTAAPLHSVTARSSAGSVLLSWRRRNTSDVCVATATYVIWSVLWMLCPHTSQRNQRSRRILDHGVRHPLKFNIGWDNPLRCGRKSLRHKLSYIQEAFACE